ncbi:MAG: dockerin type I repeat-containing protein [Clostridia bacterium]|nr:dockerin type I repeat-containing protein [Clostridia bacterium]
MTKKIMAIILSAVLCAACCIPAFAEDSEASGGFDMESILASEIVQEILATEGMSDITNVVIDVVAGVGGLDIQAMGKEKATAFIQGIIGMVGEELQDTVTNVDAFATNPVDIVDRLFDTEIKDTVEDIVDQPENSDTDLVINYGDVDGDGIYTSADARIILRRAADLITLTDEQEYLADTDGDGEITAKDARIVLRIAAGLETIDAYL